MDNVEMAQDSLEHAHGHEAHGHESAAAGHTASARLTRFAAVLVAMTAAVAVVVEMSANDRQTSYLAHDVAASDLWSQYQGKSVRHTVLQQSAAMLDAQSGLAAADPAREAKLAQAAADARAAAARLEDDSGPSGGQAGSQSGGHDGMRQIAARATAEEQARDRALELHEKYERSVRGLQIAIVLIGLFMATRLGWLLVAGSALGGAALLYGVLTALGVV